MKQKILVIGGAGYLGSMFCEKQLVKKNIVHCMDNSIYKNKYAIRKFKTNKNFKFFNFDIRNKFSNKNKYSAVVVFAGLVGDPITKKYPKESKNINEKGIKNIVNYYKKSKIRFIFISTCSNYGFIKNKIANERTKLRPKSLYASQKVNIEQFIKDQKNSSKFCPTILRFATAFGSSLRPRFDLTINEFVLNAYLKRKIDIYDHKTWRPYCHVNDFFEVINYCLKMNESKVKFNVFNVGSNKNNHRKIDVAKKIKKYLPNFNYKIIKNSKDPRDYRVNFKKISKYMRLKPFKTVDYGITEIIKFLKKQKNPKRFLKYGNYILKN